jgi:hypothetical protein
MVERQNYWRTSLKNALRLLVLGGLIWLPTVAGATTRVGNSEIQLVYEMQQAFQFKGDPTNNAEWVQWRNELRVEYQYEDLWEDGKLFGQLNFPIFRRADFSLIYRGRFDPVYLVRDKYRELYNKHQTKHYLIPENDIREINLDADFGEVFGHKLSMRFGRQQIVWGESDLFRSIDIVNPLRIDQNGFVGEAFEDFRTPIWAVKFLYDIGNVGTMFSNVGIETFYTPRWRPGTNHLILEGGWDLQYRDPRLYSAPDANGNRSNSLGPNKKYGRVRNPWSLFRVGPNAKTDAPDFGCNNLRCSPDVANDRVSFVYNIDGSRHQIRGTKWENSMIGTRILGKAFDNFDFTLNYLFKRADAAAGVEWGSAFDRNQLGPNGAGTGALRPDFPIFLARGAGGTIDQENMFFDRCMRQNREAFLVGADVYGYNTDANPNNDRNGTFCLPTFHYYPWTHVAGFTTTYNDFDYTGAVFRLEQSWSTNEPRNFSVRNSPKLLKQNGEGQDEFGNPCPAGGITCPGIKAINKKSKSGSAVWRSMIGFDLLRTWSFLPGTFGKDQWFLTGQHLMTYTNDNRPTALNPFTNAPYDRLQRWEQLFTLSGSGFFARGKLEPLWAYAYSPNAKQHLILLQAFWHGLYFNNLDLFVGTAIYAGSRFQTDASFLNYYADRDTAWIRLQYFLL